MSQYDGIFAMIDQQIAHLSQVRALLDNSDDAPATAPAKRRGRPAKAVPPKKAARRQLSDEARARIAAAQQMRWAAQKKAKAD